MKYGYLTDRIKTFQEFDKDHILRDRLIGGEPYGFTSTVHDGPCQFIYPLDEDKTIISKSECGEPILVHGEHPGERIWYCPAKQVPDIYDLARENIQDCIDVTMVSGKTLSIAVYLSSPRIVNFTNNTIEEYSTKFGKLAEKVIHSFIANADTNDEEYIGPTDAEVAETVFLSISACYRVTKDLLTQMNREYPLISTTDFYNIIQAIGDLDPKKSGISTKGYGYA